MDSNNSKSSPEDSCDESDASMDEDSSTMEDEADANVEDSDDENENEEEMESEGEESDHEEEENESVAQSKEDSGAKKKIKINDCIEKLYTGGIDNIEDMLSGKPLENFEIYDAVTLKNMERNEPFFKKCDKKWGWREELKLLEYVEDCGLFNWKGIADRLTTHNGSKFESREVQDHFNKYYLGGTLGQIWNYRLTENPVLHIDHTEDDPVDGRATSKYLPCVKGTDLKTIKFLPHREEFEVYPPTKLPMDPEMVVLKLDFSSYYMNYLKSLKLNDEVRHLQLAIVDSYRRTVSERISMHKFMKDYKLIEQFFYNTAATCAFEREFQKMQKFIPLFDSYDEYLDFYYGCVKEELLKSEIARLHQLLKTRRIKENIDVDIPKSLEMKTLLSRKAPSFLNVGLLLNSDKTAILHRTRRKKRKFKFTRRKRAK